MYNANNAKNDLGQTLLIYGLMLSVLVLFAGLAIDAGVLYVTRARLSAAADSACLTGMKNLASGQTTAATLAKDMFNANFGVNPPTPTVSFPTDQYGDQQVKVTATANVSTYFMRLLPVWATVPVSDTAVATRGKLIMSIVLDRSGSMCGGSDKCESGVTGDDGGEALQSAVPTFVDLFDNTVDEVAEISFSDNTTIDVPIGTGFQSSIQQAVKNMQFVGGTFGTGAYPGSTLTPYNGQPTLGPRMSVADLQNNSVVVQPGQN
ncbi:MAG: pilus assembly protein TadG-related protein, partial [Candidatus Korobacteraceae bacterium]